MLCYYYHGITWSAGTHSNLISENRFTLQSDQSRNTEARSVHLVGMSTVMSCHQDIFTNYTCHDMTNDDKRIVCTCLPNRIDKAMRQNSVYKLQRKSLGRKHSAWVVAMGGGGSRKPLESARCGQLSLCDALLMIRAIQPCEALG